MPSGRCVDCGTETFGTLRTGEFTESFICPDCVKNYKEEKVVVQRTITIYVKKED